MKGISLFLVLFYFLVCHFLIQAQSPKNYSTGTWLKHRGSLTQTGVQEMKGAFSDTPTLKWEFFMTHGSDGEPAIADVNQDGFNEVIVSSFDSNIYVLNGQNGSLIWKFKAKAKIQGSPAIADVNNDGSLEIVIGSLDSFIYTLKGATGDLLWKFNSGAEIYCSPSISDSDNDSIPDVIFGTSNQNIYSINGISGMLNWSFFATGAVSSSPAIGDIDNDGKQEVVFGCFDKKVYALNGMDGSLLWEYTTLGIVLSSPALGDVNNDNQVDVIIGSHDQNIYSLAGNNGVLQWIFATGSPCWASPAIADINNDGFPEIIVGCVNSNVYTLDGSGNLIWSYMMDSQCGWYSGSPKVGDFDPTSLGLEIIISTGYFQNTNQVYFLNAVGTLLWSYQMLGHTTDGVVVGDIDNDCCVEIVVSPDCCNGIFSVYVLDDIFNTNGCGYISLDTFNLSISGDSIFCSGDSVSLIANTNLPNAKYLWSTGDSSKIIKVSPVDSQTYIVSVFRNCSTDTLTALKNLNVKESANIVMNEDTVICLGDTTQLFASGGEKYLWSPTMGLSIDTIANPIAFPSSTTKYLVEIEDSQGCAYKDTVLVDVLNIASSECSEINIFISNVFNYNNNDLLIPKGLPDNIKEYSFCIYNKFGELLFITNNIQSGWNGNMNTFLANETSIVVYKIYLVYNDRLPIYNKGNITVIR